MSLANQLGRKGIMYLQAEAGLFVMLDLREFLENSSKVNECLQVFFLSHVLVRLCPASILRDETQEHLGRRKET